MVVMVQPPSRVLDPIEHNEYMGSGYVRVASFQGMVTRQRC
jgi:hypothetical protein